MEGFKPTPMFMPNIAANVEGANSDESVAQKKYYQLIDDLKSALEIEGVDKATVNHDIETVLGIIGDEAEHRLKLSEMVSHYNGSNPIAYDAIDVIDAIKNTIEDV